MKRRGMRCTNRQMMTVILMTKKMRVTLVMSGQLKKTQVHPRTHTMNLELPYLKMLSFEFLSLYSVSEEELGSSEESGKDWDELEEEARRGKATLLLCCGVLFGISDV